MVKRNRTRTAVVAVGGNSLIIDNQHESIPDQALAAASTVGHIVPLIESGWNVVVTHGNGPQVGFILRRSEIALGEVPPIPMEYASADTQGAIGFMFQRALDNEFRRRAMDSSAVTVVTQVLVDRDDVAFNTPSKPIGSFMNEEVARQVGRTQGWTVKEDSGRGWRRVVPSPRPLAIIELESIRLLVNSGYSVIACGGGGIPVIEDGDGAYQGVEAVVDKDLASALLARGLGAELFVISTAVERVAINFNTPAQKWLDRVTVSDARQYFQEGHFADGSMGPKVNAMLDYLEGGTGRGLITDPRSIGKAIAGQAGTAFEPG